MDTPDADTLHSNRLNPAVFHGSVAGIVVFLVYAIAFTEQATAFFNAGLSWIGNTFGWYYMLAIAAYLVFVILIGVSRFGSIRLGPDHSRPEFSLLSWSAMLFAAGLGGAILFFVVSEPLTHYLTPPVGEGGTPEAQRRAIVQTFMHWGISGWGLYVLMGMSLAYFSYRHRLPLAIRSTLYPLLGKRIYGPIGNAVDITAVLATVFGIATALGIGMYRSLRAEAGKADARSQVAAGDLAGSDWRERLDRTLDGSTHHGAQATLQHAIRPALIQLAEELSQRGQQATVTELPVADTQLLCPTLQVSFAGAPSFVYQIRPHRMQAPSFLPADDDYYLRLDVHLSEGGLGQDLNGYTRLQVIHDVLSEYQRHLRFLTQASERGSLETLPGNIAQPDNAPAGQRQA